MKREMSPNIKPPSGFDLQSVCKRFFSSEFRRIQTGNQLLKRLHVDHGQPSGCCPIIRSHVLTIPRRPNRTRLMPAEQRAS